MGQEISRTYFDYNAVADKATRATLRQQATAIKAAIKRTQNDIVEIGRRLIDTKSEVDHGLFMAWCEAEFHMSHGTVWNFMRVAETFGKFSNFENLNFQNSALYALSSPSVPEAAREEAIAIAASGTTVTHAKAKEIVAAHKPAPEPTPEYFTDGEAPDDEPLFGDDDDDDTGLSGSEIATGNLQQRARNAEVVFDTMASAPEPESEPEPEIDENDLTDEEWLMSLPLFALQVSRGNKMLLMRADALAWRSMQIKGAWGAFKHAADRSFNFKAAATPLADLAYQLTKVPHPRDWHGCAKCRANGCSDCRHTGYDLHVGLTVEQLEARR